MGLDRPVGVEEQHPHRTTGDAPAVIPGCPHGQIAHAVAVQITQRGHRAAEQIDIIQDAGEPAFGVADLLMRLDRAVGVEKQHPHRAAGVAPVVIPPSPHGQIAHAVAVQITQRGYREAEAIDIIQDAGEAAFGVADLLVREDRAGLGLRGHDRRERADQCDAQSE